MKQIGIVSEDAVLARLIALEAASVGLTAVSGNAVAEARCVGLFLDCRDRREDHLHRIVASQTEALIVGIAVPSEWRWLCETAVCLPYPTSLEAIREQLLLCATAQRELSPHPQNEAQSYTLVCYGTALILPDGGTVRLSVYEHTVLKYLCERVGEAVSREELNAVLGESKSNMADVYVCHLRRKFKEVTEKNIIKTVRQKGYMTQYTMEQRSTSAT